MSDLPVGRALTGVRGSGQLGVELGFEHQPVSRLPGKWGKHARHRALGAPTPRGVLSRFCVAVGMTRLAPGSGQASASSARGMFDREPPTHPFPIRARRTVWERPLAVGVPEVPGQRLAWGKWAQVSGSGSCFWRKGCGSRQ